MKFKLFTIDGVVVDTELEKKVNDWLEGKEVKHTLNVLGNIGIFYEDPKSFTKTVREKSTGR